jgi:ubiquinone/menaquinone biosynthesis C-methylase UbiE
MMSAQAEWKADFFGTVNQMPPEPVGLLIHVLEVMASEPTFRKARRELLQDLGVSAGARILDGGCGTGVALPDILEVCGRSVQVYGIDPTDAFLDVARKRARDLGVVGAEYRNGDVRALPYPDHHMDGAFCEKVLLHVGPPEAVLGELVRVTRPGGRVGAIDWQPHFVLSCTRPDLEAKFNGLFRQALCDYRAAPNLARYFAQAGLQQVRTRTYLAHTDRLGDPPFWRAFLVEQLPLFVGAGLLQPEEAEALGTDLQALDARGWFRASFVVYTAVGTKPA